MPPRTRVLNPPAAIIPPPPSLQEDTPEKGQVRRESESVRARGYRSRVPVAVAGVRLAQEISSPAESDGCGFPTAESDGCGAPMRVACRRTMRRCPA
eukprot:5858232-Pyramimonas_sp.AAC.1